MQRRTDLGWGRGSWRSAALALLTAAVLTGGSWGLTAPRAAQEDGHADAGTASGTVDLPDGTLRVDGLVDRQVGHVMPGMNMTDEVPAGLRRFAVDVSLGATEGRPMSYDRRDLTVSGPGVEPVAPVDGQIDRGVLAPGSAISGSLSFDVPEDASALVLRYGDSAAVTLPDLPGGPGQQAGHPTGAPAPAPAHGHDDSGSPPHEH